MKKNNFLESLCKIASPLFSTSMSERYDHLNDSYVEDEDTLGDIEYTPSVDQADLWKLRKGYSKFHTAPKAEATVTPKEFDYKLWSTQNEFSNVAPHIVTHESGGKKLISNKANDDGTFDYGFYQINDANLDRKTSGKDVADAFDPIFEQYYNTYKKDYEGKTEENGYVYPTLNENGSLDVENRRTLLQIPHLDFNDVSGGLSYDLAQSLYGLRGIDQWTTKDKVIESLSNTPVASSK